MQKIPLEWKPAIENVSSHGQVIVYHPEVDPYVQHTAAFPLVEAIMGRQEVRFAQFDFRDVPHGVGDTPMKFHRDRGFYPPAGTTPKNGLFEESSYLCVIHYLSDVKEHDPCFCVVPNSHLQAYNTHAEAKEKMGSAYREIPIRGPAGTAVFYNVDIYHTRRSGLAQNNRRTQHSYYSCVTSPPLTNWVLVPQRLAEHEDPAIRRYYSQWTAATQAFADSGYADTYYQEHVIEKPT
ncbi:MAG: phytanoyl-CoA dioxygenase family protein [Candidatus Latescibacterota bacterium]|jgi:ectoine hydroxylase-related dioxygenase (phytanoyl-CoA dioxygenase family)